MQCAANQPSVDRRLPRYNDIYFMNKLIIISSYTFLGCTSAHYQMSHCVHSGLVHVVCSSTLKARPSHAIEICLNETTVQTSIMLWYRDLTSPLHFLKLELGSKKLCESSQRN